MGTDVEEGPVTNMKCMPGYLNYVIPFNYHNNLISEVLASPFCIYFFYPHGNKMLYNSHGLKTEQDSENI